MSDTRFPQWGATIDDLRCEVADMADESPPPEIAGELVTLRRYLNWCIESIDRLKEIGGAT